MHKLVELSKLRRDAELLERATLRSFDACADLRGQKANHEVDIRLK